ncbi:MAG TPA: VOC family protein [Kofleriaceae bacterium]|nr:VOC family protein [Kofleriaceae bacterium]
MLGPFHHIGCAVKDLDASLQRYQALLGASARRSRVFDVPSQAVRVCFVEIAPRSYLELVAATASPSPIERYCRTGFYHLCFLVGDLAATLAAIGREYRPLPAFESEAFGGRRCQFVVTPESHLLELAETTAESFASFFDAHVM